MTEAVEPSQKGVNERDVMTQKKRIFRAWFHPSQVEQGRRFVDAIRAEQKSTHRCADPRCIVKVGLHHVEPDPAVPAGYYRWQNPSDANWEEMPLDGAFDDFARKPCAKIVMRVHPRDLDLAVRSRRDFERTPLWEQLKRYTDGLDFEVDPAVPRGRMLNRDPQTGKDENYPLPSPDNGAEAALGLVKALDERPELLKIPAFAALAGAMNIQVFEDDVIVRARSGDMKIVRAFIEQQSAGLTKLGRQPAALHFETDDDLPEDIFSIGRPINATSTKFPVPNSPAAARDMAERAAARAAGLRR